MFPLGTNAAKPANGQINLTFSGIESLLSRSLAFMTEEGILWMWERFKRAEGELKEAKNGHSIDGGIVTIVNNSRCSSVSVCEDELMRGAAASSQKNLWLA